MEGLPNLRSDKINSKFEEKWMSTKNCIKNVCIVGFNKINESAQIFIRSNFSST